MEDKIRSKLEKELNPSQLEIMDTSGGCGTFFGIQITSSKFNGLTMIKQHKLVNEILKEEISQVHGITYHTKPDE